MPTVITTDTHPDWTDDQEPAIYPDWLPEPLEPVVARLARVDDCLHDLVDLVGEWSLHALDLEELRRADGRTRMVVSAIRPIAPAVSLLFSEAIGHLRATLDNVVWHLVSQEAGDLDEAAARLVDMPIYDDPEKFAGWVTRRRRSVPALADESSVLHQRVRALQPYSDGASVPSFSPALEILTRTESEKVHPLLLLQGYSNIDKHRSIATMSGASPVTTSAIPLLTQDLRFRPLNIGDAIANGRVGELVEVELSPAVVVQRPAPWVAYVSPAKEAERLRDWVIAEALPYLVTGSTNVQGAIPVTINLDDDGRVLRDRIAEPGREPAHQRGAALLRRRYAEAEARPLQVPGVVYREFGP